ncbi:MAG: DNA-3-methyladenine glycosylase family protein [Calditrichia bacterium]
MTSSSSITQIVLKPNSPFDFNATVTSHGWVALKPNAWDAKKATLTRIQQLDNGEVVRLTIRSNGSNQAPNLTVAIESKHQLSGQQQNEISSAVSYMLRLDEDLSGFYARCNKHKHWSFLNNGAGRLLRSPSLFEDLIKTIFTTNIQWGGTIRMTEELVNALGKSFHLDHTLKAFPTPQAIVQAQDKLFETDIRLGYRTAYIREIAATVASGNLELEAYQSSDLSTPELRKVLLSIKGIGNYAAATMLMFLERYDELAIDTVFRDFVTKRYFNGKKAGEKEMRAIYDQWDEWKFLAFWFDMWKSET